MAKIDIDTTQNILINYDLAGIGPRIGAYLIDTCILLVFLGLGGATAFVFHDIGADWVFFTILGIIGAGYAFYHLLMEVFAGGQSIGKRAAKIKVARLDGTEPSFTDYFLRWIFRLIDILIPSGAIALISIAVSEKGQRLGDMAAGTTVISTRPKKELKDLWIHSHDEKYQVVFPQVSTLGDRDIALMKDIMNTGKESQNPVIFNELADKMKSILEIESELPPKQFLETLIKDYQHYHLQ